MQGNGRTLFGSAFDYSRPDEPEYPLGHRPGQSYFGAETTYDLTQVVLNRRYIRRLKQLYYDKIDCSEEKVWGQRNGELTIKDYFNLSDQQRFVLERLHAIKDELKGAVNFKYVNLRDALVSSDDADDIARLEGLEAEKTELDNFLAGKTGVYNQYSFLCEVLKYHKAKYSGEKVDDEVLGAFLKEFSLNNEGLSIEDQKTIIESFHAIESIDASTDEGDLSRANLRSRQEKTINDILDATGEDRNLALEKLQGLTNTAATVVGTTLDDEGEWETFSPDDYHMLISDAKEVEEAAPKRSPRKLVLWDFDGPINLLIRDQQAYNHPDACPEISIPSYEHLRCTMAILHVGRVYSVIGSQRVICTSVGAIGYRDDMFESLDKCLGESRPFLTEDIALKMADSAAQANDGINLEEVTNSDKTPLIRAARQVVPGAQALRNQDFILVDDNIKYAGSCREEGFTFIYADSKKSPERATKRNIDHLGEVLVEALPASRIQSDIDRYAKDETVRSDLKAAVCKAYVAKNRHNLEIIYRAIDAGVTHRWGLNNPFSPHISDEKIVAKILSQPDSLAARIYRISMQHGDAGHDESNHGLIRACAQEAAHLSRFSRHKMSWKASPTEIAQHIARNPDSRTAKVAKALPEPVEHHSTATPFLGAGLAVANGAVHECNGFVHG